MKPLEKRKEIIKDFVFYIGRFVLVLVTLCACYV